MYNSSPYNSSLYGGTALAGSIASEDVFQYDDYGLQNSSIIVTNSDHATPPSRDFSTYRVPRNNGRIISGNFFDQKVITLEGYLKASGASAFETLLDTFKKRLSAKDGVLQITEPNGVVKRWTTNLTSPEKLLAERKGWMVDYCPFKAEFTCVEPFGHDAEYTVIYLGGQTAATFNQTLTNIGNAAAEPVIFLQFTGANSVTQIEVQNVTTGAKMRISGLTVVAGDIFELNTETKEVLQNGVAIDYDGSFIELEPDDNNIQADITSTSHTVGVTYKHKNAYL